MGSFPQKQTLTYKLIIQLCAGYSFIPAAGLMAETKKVVLVQFKKSLFRN